MKQEVKLLAIQEVLTNNKYLVKLLYKLSLRLLAHKIVRHHNNIYVIVFAVTVNNVHPDLISKCDPLNKNPCIPEIECTQC